ncbi:hypothetical protein RYX56_08780 [Alkalihalophilus lindianensis]|uniref:Uncharacterized protein n=1 Tax=Alkalihalophilus lindianensis TaxID=1630542 RepID=A0ABU3X9I0_9BACI|nr:hypothetical protein [Alkalihalophilus lindianensis]MDV2684463.1 hypothetical protein [Alkalihalophilus lindianensis]
MNQIGLLESSNQALDVEAQEDQSTQMQSAVQSMDEKHSFFFDRNRHRACFFRLLKQPLKVKNKHNKIYWNIYIVNISKNSI